MDKDLASFIDRIYEAALEPHQWNELLPDIVKWLDCLAADMSVVHHGQGIVANVSVNPDPTVLPEYLEYYWAINPRVELGATARVGQIMSDRDIPLDQRRQSEYYQEYLPRHRLGDYMGMPMRNDPEGLAYIGFLLAGDAGAPTQRQLERLSALKPHLVRAHQVQERLGTLQGRTEALTAVSDHMVVAVLVLDGQGRVVFMNRAARQLVTEGDALRLEGLAPVAAFRGARGGLATAINDVLAGEMAGRPAHGGATLQLPRQSGARPLNVLVTRLPTSQAFAPGGVAALLVTDPERLAPGTEALLADLYHLTRQEATLARDLMNGLSVEDHARSRGVSITTARTHLRNLLRKTHTGRQAELVALLMRSAGFVA